jgi:hypothetical protein
MQKKGLCGICGKPTTFRQVVAVDIDRGETTYGAWRCLECISVGSEEAKRKATRH